MKYSFFAIFSMSIICLFLSCSDDEATPTTPDCIQNIIDDLTQNDSTESCLASVKRYTFAGVNVFEVQEDACLDGPSYILNESCDTLCVLNVFGQMTECDGSTNFYDDAELVETIWLEEN